MKRGSGKALAILARSPASALLPSFLKRRFGGRAIALAKRLGDDSPSTRPLERPQLGVDLAGCVALVTGGNSGIGRAAALALAHSGASVGIVGRDEERNAAILAELDAIGVESTALRVDLTDRIEAASVVARVEEQLGPLSILVNSAGAGSGGGLLSTNPADWNRILETNLTAPFFLMQSAARSMAGRRQGKIINIASVAGLMAVSSPAYGASKGGLLHLTRCVAKEFAEFNVQVNAIAPGWIDTDMTSSVKYRRSYKQILEDTPAGRWGDVNEVAAAVLYLASPTSDFITGATFVIDGGLSIAASSR